MNTEMQYQVLLLGPDKDKSCPSLTNVSSTRGTQFVKELAERIQDLGLHPDTHFLLTSDVRRMNPDSPAVVVWFDNANTASHEETRELENLADRGIPIFPVVDSLDGYPSRVPPLLQPLNGKPWDKRDEVITGTLTALGLLRSAKRVFISYKRSETTGIARQLFRELQLRGYQAFLDTARIAPGKDVQADLVSELANVDVIILLHSKEALNSIWVMEEIIDAHIRGTEVIDLLFHDAKRQSDLDLAIPYDVPPGSVNNFGDGESITLAEPFLERLLTDVERYRIRSVQTRRNRIIRQLTEDAETLNIPVANRLTGSIAMPHVPYLEFTLAGSNVVAAIVSQGIPDSREVHSRDSVIKSAANAAVSFSSTISSSRIVYDEYGVLNDDLRHLGWLNHLTKSAAGTASAPAVETLRLCDAFQWLKDSGRSAT